MGLDIVSLHKKIDEWAAEQREAETQASAEPVIVEAAIVGAEVPKPTVSNQDKQAVRTKTSGDRVYLIDKVNKTRQWVTTPEIVAALGFDMATDIVEIDEPEFLKYTMAPPIHKLPDAPTA